MRIAAKRAHGINEIMILFGIMELNVSRWRCEKIEIWTRNFMIIVRKF